MKTVVCATSALSIFALVLAIAPSHAAPTEWTVASGGNGHLYEVFRSPNGLTWDGAQADAVARGGYLATILSLPENSFVFGLVTAGGLAGTSPWLGGFQPPGTPGEPAEGWQWVHGDGPFVFTNWGPGEPNNVGEEDNLQFRSDGLWNDIPGSALLTAHVVEFDPPTNRVPEGGSALALLGIALFALETVRRKIASA